MKQCKWCDHQFKSSVSYQIYCSSECRTHATKEKIVERHQILKRQKRKHKTRYCAGGCGTILSMYNDEKYCVHCAIHPKQVEKKIKEIKNILDEYGN